MRPRQLTLILATAVALFAQADVTLQRAMRKETLEGDLKGAIALYEKTVAEAKSDRATAAKALIRMAECHTKLGDAEARNIYERVLRDYADQKEAATTARARLGAASPMKGDRAVWTGPKVDLFGRVSPDGRLLSFTDWSAGATISLHDLRTGSNRPLAKAGFGPSGYIGGAQFSTISKDSKQVAYEWYNEKNQVEIRVVPMEGSGIPESRRVFANPDVESVNVSDWSPDGKWLAVHLRRKDLSSQVALVSVADGELRVLKTVDWRGPSKLFFSPDGKYIAYDLPTSEASEHRSIFVMARDGSRETVVVAHPSQNIVMGWTPGGKSLLFSSDRTGAMSLWALPVADGKSSGSPQQVKPEGSDWSLGITDAGALLVFKSVGSQDIRVATLDVGAGRIVEGAPGPVPNYIASRGRPDWSRDGRYLSYASCGNLGGGGCKLLIRSMETGQVRELPHRLSYFVTARWSPDGSTFVTQGTDRKGRKGIYTMDSRSGDTTLVVEGNFAEPQWLPDGKSITYLTAGSSQIVQRELATGKERLLYQSQDKMGSARLSPDGGYHLVTTRGLSGKTSVALLVPVEGGEPRELFRVNQPEAYQGFGGAAWMPDGSAALVIKVLADRRSRELWLVPVAGSQPRRLNIDVSDWARGTGFTLHPSGQQIAFVAGERESEVWALENFLPTLSAKK